MLNVMYPLRWMSREGVVPNTINDSIAVTVSIGAEIGNCSILVGDDDQVEQKWI